MKIEISALQVLCIVSLVVSWRRAARSARALERKLRKLGIKLQKVAV